ncbi:MAG: hypothetical protein H7123_08530 [Thermoleophilia bacterium]|nr:hypothetical protein [Thermoleophilia bacterium]
MRRSSLIKTFGYAIALVVAWRLASELEHARRELVLVRVRARQDQDADRAGETGSARTRSGSGTDGFGTSPAGTAITEPVLKSARVFRDTGIIVEEFASVPVSAAPIDLVEMTAESLAATPFAQVQGLVGSPVMPLVRTTAAPQVAGSPLHSVPRIVEQAPADLTPATPSVPVAVVFSGGPEPDIVVPLPAAVGEAVAAVTHTPLAEPTEVAPESFTQPGVVTPATAARAHVAETAAPAANVERIYPSAAAAVAAAHASYEAEVMVPTGTTAVASAAPSALSRLEPLSPADQPTVLQPAVAPAEVAAISAALDRSTAHGTAVHEATIANVLDRSELAQAADDIRVPPAWPWLLIAVGGMGAVTASLALPHDQNAWSYAGGGVGAVLVAFIGSRFGTSAARARAATG